MSTKVQVKGKRTPQQSERHIESAVTLIIPSRLPSMNEIIKASKSHYGQYSSMKSRYTNMVAMHARKQGLPVFESVKLEITWYCKNKRQDPDNISAGSKMLIDGLVKAGKLSDDGWGQIKGIMHHFEVDKLRERVEVVLKEAAE